MKARKKPVVIEYYPCHWDFVSEILGWSTSDRPILPIQKTEYTVEIIIETLEWNYKATEKDMIIKWVNWEVYPCKKDIFEKTYEIIKEKEENIPKFWDIFYDKEHGRVCRYVKAEYDDEGETGRHYLLDDGENLFTTNLKNYEKR